VDPKADVAEDQAIVGCVGMELGLFNGVSVQQNGNSRIDMRDGRAGLKFKRADMRRGGRWEHDVVCSVRAESVFTFVKPAEA
jgi:hypothetical protein